MIRKPILIGSIAVALAAGTGAVATASSAPPSPQQGGKAAVAKAAAPTLVAAAARPVQCNGGAQKAVRSTLTNQYTTFPEGPGIALAGPVVVGPAKGADTINVTFSAESQLRGTTDDYDWIELQVLLDGRPMQPVGPADSPMALTGSTKYAMTTAQFCGRIGPGRHSLRATARIVDNGTNNTLTGWVDDWVLKAEISE
jgi:hypothetical protein